MKNLEIIVQTPFIELDANNLKKIAYEVKKKSIRNRVLDSKGNTSESFNFLIDQLNDIGKELGEIMAKNAKYVHNIAENFKKMDDDLASDMSD